MSNKTYEIAEHSVEPCKFTISFPENSLVDIIIFTHAYPRGENKTELFMSDSYVGIVNLPISEFKLVTENQITKD